MSIFYPWLGEGQTNLNSTYSSYYTSGCSVGAPVLATQLNAALRMSTIIASTLGNRFFSTLTIDNSQANFNAALLQSVLGTSFRPFSTDETSFLQHPNSIVSGATVPSNSYYRSVFGSSNGVPVDSGAIFGKFGVGGNLFAVGCGTSTTPKNAFDIDASGNVITLRPNQKLVVNNVFEVDATGVQIKKSPAVSNTTENGYRPVLRKDISVTNAPYLHTISFCANATRQFCATLQFVSAQQSITFTSLNLYTILKTIYDAALSTNKVFFGTITSAPQSTLSPTETCSAIVLDFNVNTCTLQGIRVDGSLLSVASVTNATTIVGTIKNQRVISLPQLQYNPQTF